MRFLTTIFLLVVSLAALASANNDKKSDVRNFRDVVKDCVVACNYGPHCAHYCECKVYKLLGKNIKCNNDPTCKKPGPKGCEKYELSGKVRRDEDTSAAVDQAASATVEEASSETAAQVDPGTINYNQDAPEDFVQTADVNGDDNTCATQGCSEALPYCLKACGYGPHCEGYCACMLHSNPKSICRQKGCVEAPQDCDQWEFTDHDIALAGPETADYEQVAAAANAREGSDDDDVNSEHCKACRDAGYECSKKCGADDMICKALCLCASTAEDNCGRCKSVDCPRT
ncbi:uncharacterized protein J4E87_006309 [Alternaria ethzedia]|uniref:uncharacterized protein n=1 Tax=Alternaria ethzedia TaxID=181014 RepID=UPI0020C38B7C|nr:uncharacterized protein J4E87_006309 [Alternaria ethzedia]KAI4622742.1 hypothetical protein J4E87_006309 [Alternaria ethzedia]